MYQSSAPLSAVSQQDLRGILNERDSDARQQALHAAGAKNAAPPQQEKRYCFSLGPHACRTARHHGML